MISRLHDPPHQNALVKMSMSFVRFYGADEEKSQVGRDQILLIIIKSAGGDDDLASMSLPTPRSEFSPIFMFPPFLQAKLLSVVNKHGSLVWFRVLLSVLLLAEIGFRCRDHASCLPALTMIRLPYPCKYMVNILPIYVSPLVQAEQFSIVNCHASLFWFLVYVICLLLAGMNFRRRDHVSCPRPNGRLLVVCLAIR